MNWLKERCLKCQGVVVEEVILLHEGGGWAIDRRCINCGKRFNDQVLMERRRDLQYLRTGKEKR